jgi:uncharacterized protein DUF3467
VDGSPDSHGNAEFRLYLPADLESGAYANFLAVWHTVHEFTLDFCSRQPPRQEESEEADAAVVVQCRVVARVKIPPTLVFDVLQALNRSMTQYESVFGEIQRPGDKGGE